MPIHLLRLVYRERRRVGVLVVFCYIALRLAAPAVAAQPFHVAGLFGLGAAFAGLSVLAPRLRGITEVVALACLAFAAIVRALPESALDLAMPAGNLLVAVGVWLGLAALARGSLRGLEALPLPRLRGTRFKARAGSRVDIHRLWYGLVPAAAAPPLTDTPDRAIIEDMSLRLGRIRLVDHIASEPTTAPRLQILEAEAPFHIRLRAHDGSGLLGEAGISEFFIVDLGPQRLVLFAHDCPRMPLGRAILAWLDDAPGRMLDRQLADIERCARSRGAASLSDWDDDAARDEPVNQRLAS